MLHSWYKGGPTIRLSYIIDTESKKPLPDLNPITIIISTKLQEKGILMSLKATGVYLHKVIEELLHINPNDLRLQYKNLTKKQGSTIIQRDLCTLKSYGLTTGAIIECLENNCVLLLEEEEKIIIPNHKAKQKKNRGTKGEFLTQPGLLSEEEMIQLAIKASLNEINENNGVNKTKELRRRPLIQIKTDIQSEPEKPERPKTPSTGTIIIFFSKGNQLQLEEQNVIKLIRAKNKKNIKSWQS